MRTVVNFRVTGKSMNEIKEKASAQYRELLDDPDAVIPYSATIEISPEEVVEATDGTKVAIVWKGEVDITVAANTGPE